MSYELGQRPRLTVTFTASGVVGDPTAVTLLVRTPDNVETSYTYAAAQLTKSSTGVYYRDITCDQAGNWYYAFTGTGALIASVNGGFYVNVRKA